MPMLTVGVVTNVATSINGISIPIDPPIVVIFGASTLVDTVMASGTIVCEASIVGGVTAAETVITDGTIVCGPVVAASV